MISRVKGFLALINYLIKISKTIGKKVLMDSVVTNIERTSGSFFRYYHIFVSIFIFDHFIKCYSSGFNFNKQVAIISSRC